MTNQVNPTEIEVELADVSLMVRKYEALKRLQNNEDFKTVILDGYIREGSIDKVSWLAAHQTRMNGSRPIIMEELVAISAFEQYLLMIERLGAAALEDLESEDEE